ncbi:penicillin-binding protein [Mesobacillus maritimus]|uniref:penicillin-binding protein n=1 Tax=Mesobacillus maritimus TaxID=1643336 RepID=UPI00203F7E62|nr:penicillin-binding protein [Mesobacillus maritimus]MCM3587089.1 penicillin-binding protein [Mesobacillus maritimus]MCM3667654.1 penicillin-binding protein [Mesobacillus maritimus]
MSKKQPNMNVGAAGLFFLFSLLFFILIYRFLSIQITGEAHGQALAAKAQQKYSNETVIEAVRGTIYDRNEEVIAEDASAYTLVAILDEEMTSNPKEPKHVVDPAKTASILANYIDMEESEIYERLTREGLFQVEFGQAGRDISHQIKSEIEKKDLPGIIFTKSSKRFYPNGVFSSHLIGFVEKKENEDGKTETIGQLGIEQSMNDLLTGKNGSLNIKSDLWGFLLPNSEKQVTPAENGKNVYLTIDKKIQTFLEDAMNRVEEEYEPEKIMAIVADPKTGEILAMGQRPTFHPQTREGIDKTWHNEIIETTIEPGSTMKIFTLAAAVEEGVFNPNETFESGSYRVTPKSVPIRDHNWGRGWGTISYLEGIQRSSNVAVAKLVNEKIGTDTFRNYLTSFGFDQPTGIDLPNEVTGKVQYEWPIEKITTSFGQGTTMTPIQLVQAATAIANDGKMMKPQIIDKIVDSDSGEVVKQVKPEIVGTPISPETAKEVRDILESTVTNEDHGTATSYQIEGYDVSGKTGTAQLPGDDGKYLTGRENFLFSFLGMAPTEDPELIVYVAVQQPKIDESTSGATPVSEIFNPVMKSSLQYLNIQPTVTEKVAKGEIPDVTGTPTSKAVSMLEKEGLTPVVLGDGKEIETQLPVAGADTLEGERVLLKTSGKEIIAPDMTDWSLRDAMKFAKIAEVKLNKAGSGYVSKQSIKPGTKVKKGEYLIVELTTPLQRLEEETKEKDSEDGSNEESSAEETNSEAEEVLGD